MKIYGRFFFFLGESSWVTSEINLVGLRLDLAFFCGFSLAILSPRELVFLLPFLDQGLEVEVFLFGFFTNGYCLLNI